MTAFLPRGASDAQVQPDHPVLRQRPLTPAEARARWEVRAAQWRARELAEAVFGEVGAMKLTGLRADGPLRGLLRLDVAFRGLRDHREKEARFLAAVDADPLLSNVRLIYVIGPDVGD